MVLYRTIKTLILVLFINNCYAKHHVKPRIFKILEKGNKVILENDDDSGYNSKELLKFVQNYADIEYYVKNILNKNTLGKYPDGIHALGKKRILAKRIVPPGQKTPDFEYDNQYETYFKPLVKIHKVKKMEKQDEDLGVLSDTSSSSDESEQYIENFDTDDLIYVNNRDLLKVVPKEKKVVETIDNKQQNRRMSIEEQGARFLKDIQQMIHMLIDKRQKNIIRERLSIIIQELEELHAILFDLVENTNNLRALGADSATMLVMPQPGANFDKGTTDALKAEQDKPQRVPVFLPHNPLWNYWTVRQTIKL